MPSVTRKCKAFLAHFSPRSLVLPAPCKSVSRVPSAVQQSLPVADSCSGSHSPWISCRPGFDSSQPYCAASAADKADHHFTSPSDSSPLTSDMDQLLHLCLRNAQNDVHKQTSALDALCTICSASPGAADVCINLGGVEIVLTLLNSPPPHHIHHAQVFPASPFVEKNEKALQLLRIITTSSESGCADALQHTASIIQMLGEKLLRLSNACTSSAIRILLTLCCHSEAALFRKAASETAIPSKLVVVLQVDVEDSTKQSAGRLLRLLAAEQQRSG